MRRGTLDKVQGNTGERGGGGGRKEGRERERGVSERSVVLNGGEDKLGYL